MALFVSMDTGRPVRTSMSRRSATCHTQSWVSAETRRVIPLRMPERADAARSIPSAPCGWGKWPGRPACEHTFVSSAGGHRAARASAHAEPVRHGRRRARRRGRPHSGCLKRSAPVRSATGEPRAARPGVYLVLARPKGPVVRKAPAPAALPGSYDGPITHHATARTSLVGALSGRLGWLRVGER
jgi:hypothetical protein